jgi:hypothetical protein
MLYGAWLMFSIWPFVMALGRYLAYYYGAWPIYGLFSWRFADVPACSWRFVGVLAYSYSAWPKFGDYS